MASIAFLLKLNALYVNRLFRNTILLLVSFVYGTASYAQPTKDIDVRRANEGGTKFLALVVGNKSYQHLSTLNGVDNDATAVASKLESMGFTISNGKRINLTHDDMTRETARFIQRIDEKTVALVYFSGHGVAVQNQNYLISTDAKIESEEEVAMRTTSVDLLLQQIERRNPKASVAILDACRNTPAFVRNKSLDGGLAVINATGSKVFFATAPGKVAQAGLSASSRSIFTDALLEAFDHEDNDTLNRVFEHASRLTKQRTNNRQDPWANGSGAFDFRIRQRSAGRTDTSTDPETLDWNRASASGTDSALRSYIDKYPQGRYVRLARAGLSQPAATSEPSTPNLSKPETKPTGITFNRETTGLKQVGVFNFEGPDARSDKTLLSFDEADQNIVALGVPFDVEINEPFELRTLADLNQVRLKGQLAHGSGNWTTGIALTDRSTNLKLSQKTWATVDVFPLKPGLISGRRLLRPKGFSMNGSSDFDVTQETAIANLPCSGKDVRFTNRPPITVGKMALVAGRWSIKSGTCTTDIALVDAGSGRSHEIVSVDSEANNFVYKSSGSKDLFIQSYYAKLPSQVKTIPITEAPASAGDRQEFTSVKLSPKGSWVAGWTKFSTQKLTDAFVPIFSSQSDRKMRLNVPGRVVHDVLFASEQKVIILSQVAEGQHAKPMHISVFNLTNQQLLAQFLVEDVRTVRGTAVSRSGKHLAVAVASDFKSRTSVVHVFDLL